MVLDNVLLWRDFDVDQDKYLAVLASDKRWQASFGNAKLIIARAKEKRRNLAYRD